MARSAMIVLADAEPGRLGELVDWYRERHIPEMLTVPGIASAEQYRPLDEQGEDASGALLTIYLFDTDETDGVLAGLAARRPGMSSSTALAATTVWLAHGLHDDTDRSTS